MRIFVAVECGEEIAGNAAAAIARLRAHVAERAPAARLTWAAPERLHLTVRFIGEVAPATAETIAAALAPPLPLPAFTFTVGGLGTFPPRGAPRVLWAGLRSGPDELHALDRAVTGRLLPLGVPPEDRPYSPHLTLARVRDAAGLRAADLVAPLAEAAFGTAQVDAITLFESRLSPKGATYRPLQRTPLASGT